MKLGIIVILISIASLIGCAPHVQNTVPPTRDVVYVTSAPAPSQCPTGQAAQQGSYAPGSLPQAPQPLPEKEDNFQKAGDVFAASSRFVYDSASGSWHWSRSTALPWVRDELAAHQDDIDAAKRKAAELAEQAKRKAQEEYHKLMGPEPVTKK